MTHVPYKGNAEAVRSVLSGETQIMFTPSTVTLPLVKSGKLKVIAVYLTEQIDELPGVRSMAAQGMDGFDANNLPFWYGLLAPAGTPKASIARIHADTLKALQDEKVASALKAARIFAIGNSPEEFAAMIRVGACGVG
jgi:tripartite-type tricarboxylate transporter receptor subunit TctC